MLRDIAALWQKNSLMMGAVQTLGEMVGEVTYVYTHAWEVCVGKAVAEAIAEDVRASDKAVNKGERRIRRTVVEHLNLNPGKDVSGCLALMIMAKDVERIGDHARNIFGLGAALDAPLTGYALFGEMAAVQEKIEGELRDLQRAVTESSDSVAREILESYQNTKVALKTLQSRLFTEQFAGEEAVVTALLTRALTRINAHLGNAASGVVFPLEDIDFVNRGLRRERGE